MPAEVMRRTIMEKWMRKRLMGAGLALMLLPGILAGCSGTEEAGKELTEVTLNEVAHSIFYAPMYVAVEEGKGTLKKKGLRWIWYVDLGFAG